MCELLAGAAEVEVVDGRRAGGADVILSLDGRFRAGRGQRTVTAVHDLGHLFERKGYGPGRWLAQNWRVASAVRRSDHLLAPSNAVAFGLERYLRTTPDRITVVPPLPRACFARPARERVEEARAELGLPGRYFLFVGSRARRKNLGMLAEAWGRASVELGDGVGLVLAGPGAGGVPGALDLGYLPAERLPAVIGGALAWLNPSFYEGSAIGALEAMACGAPPLVAGTGAQPRAVGMAGLILDPHDPGQWARAMVAVARDVQLRASLRAASLKTAAGVRGTAPRSAELLAALRGAAAGGS